MLGRPPNRIDLITGIDGVTFQEAWAEKEAGYLDNLPVYFISKTLLIVNKLATNREKDKLDVKMLQKMKHTVSKN